MDLDFRIRTLNLNGILKGLLHCRLLHAKQAPTGLRAYAAASETDSYSTCCFSFQNCHFGYRQHSQDSGDDGDKGSHGNQHKPLDAQAGVAILRRLLELSGCIPALLGYDIQFIPTITCTVLLLYPTTAFPVMPLHLYGQ